MDKDAVMKIWTTGNHTGESIKDICAFADELFAIEYASRLRAERVKEVTAKNAPEIEKINAYLGAQQEPDGEVVASAGVINDLVIIKWTSGYHPKVGDKIYAAPVTKPAAQDCVSVPREPSTGIAVIAAERWRQVKQEGWTPEHDAEHDAGELSAAGAAYAMNAADQLHPYSQGDGDNLQPVIWPWDSKWWKPKDPLRDLARAGALIAAEIDKLLAAHKEPK